MKPANSPPPPMAPPPAAPRQAAAPTMRMPTVHRAGIRAVLVAVNGYGKTTAAAHGPDPVVVMAPDELGYMTLLSRGLVPAVPVVEPTTWPETLASIDAIADAPQGRKTIVLDALTGFEMLLAAHVCKTQCGGDWGEKGFMAFYRGPAQVAREWPALLMRLTRAAEKGLNVLVIGHAKSTKFKNPDGPDYDRYECACGTEDLWGRTRNWAEAVLFGNFRAIVDTARPEANIAKASGKAIGQERILRCQHSAAADAKNQYGLQPEYVMPDEPQAFAAAFWNLILPKGK